jgi:hypothetical protein
MIFIFPSGSGVYLICRHWPCHRLDPFIIGLSSAVS